ncbi:thymidylate kinase [Legionella erythra]|uniref:Thymidylate kinase n=2 Tax=Legionella erythra TaxID=448 RepID=A0A0W0TRK7_LEGER|nr:dTMP kinase [Legionella erythra]KTC98140.1 thymidylate kinase [Legionella erythra]
MTQGCFVVVEGLEGAGKSTVIKTIKQALESRQLTVVTTREPGGTHIGETIRHLIKEPRPQEPMSAYTELLLLYAARVQLLDQVIRPALKKGEWVLADRFELSTFAYQGGGRQIDWNIIDAISRIALQGFQPDLILFLDIHPERGMERVTQRGESDRIEQESQAFFDRVNQAYHKKIKSLDNVALIDASQTLEAVQKSALLHLENFLTRHAAL